MIFNRFKYSQGWMGPCCSTFEGFTVEIYVVSGFERGCVSWTVLAVQAIYSWKFGIYEAKFLRFFASRQSLVLEAFVGKHLPTRYVDKGQSTPCRFSGISTFAAAVPRFSGIRTLWFSAYCRVFPPRCSVSRAIAKLHVRQTDSHM